MSSSNAIEVNGVWYTKSPVNNAQGNNRGRRRPTARSRNWQQGQRSQPQQMLIGSTPIQAPSWTSFPNEQWHEVSGFSFPDAWGSGTIAYASMKTEVGKIKSLHLNTTVYSCMYGFTCKAAGYAGFVTGFTPEAPIEPMPMDRVRILANKYCAKQLVLPKGSTIADLLRDYTFVWKFDAEPAAGSQNMISIAKFYVSTVPLPGIKPPPNFLVCEMPDK